MSLTEASTKSVSSAASLSSSLGGNPLSPRPTKGTSKGFPPDLIEFGQGNAYMFPVFWNLKGAQTKTCCAEIQCLTSARVLDHQAELLCHLQLGVDRCLYWKVFKVEEFVPTLEIGGRTNSRDYL